MAFTEIYTALQTGAIDGQDNPLPTDKDSKFYEVTKQIVLTSHLVDHELPRHQQEGLGRAHAGAAEDRAEGGGRRRRVRAGRSS